MNAQPYLQDMLPINWKNRNLRHVALVAAGALIIGVLMSWIGATHWAFLLLFAFWIAGNFLAWMKRHPTSQR